MTGGFVRACITRLRHFRPARRRLVIPFISRLNILYDYMSPLADLTSCYSKASNDRPCGFDDLKLFGGGEFLSCHSVQKLLVPRTSAQSQSSSTRLRRQFPLRLAQPAILDSLRVSIHGQQCLPKLLKKTQIFV